MQPLLHRIYCFDDFQLDTLKRQLLCGGRPVPLQGKAFELLRTLVERSGQVLEKEELYRLTWPEQIVEESNLTVHISAIRKALGERSGQPRYITTISGRGYCFVADVHELEGDGDELLVEQHTFACFVVEHEDLAAELSTDADISQLRPPGENNGGKLLSNRNMTSKLPITVPTTLAVSGDSALETRDGRRIVLLTAGGLICALLAAGGFGYWRGSGNRAKNAAATTPPLPQMTIKRLTNQGRISSATLSPDGKSFVYLQRERDGQASLWLSHVDGSGSIMLRPPAEVGYGVGITFAPDGSSLYYCMSDTRHPRGQLFRSPVLGGVPEKLGFNACSAMTFSPDGKQVGFVRTDRSRGASLLMVANLNGSGEREIAARPLTKRFVGRTPAWSPDGSTIAVGAVSIDNGESNEIFGVRVSDGTIERITALEWKSIQRMSWFGDGGGLIVVAAAKNSWQQIAQLWSVTYPTGEARKITSDLNSYGSVASLSADDSALLAVQGQTITSMWVAPATNFEQARQITFGAHARYDGLYGFDWTPEGRIVYVAMIGESPSIWIVDGDGSNARQLTPAGNGDINPSVTADGRHLVFQSNRSGTYDIWRTDTDGGNPQRLTSGGGNTEPHVSPDGRMVVYVSSRDGLRGLWRVSIDGGEPVRLTDKPAMWPRISPDGKLIACGYVSDLDSTEGGQIAVVSVEGGLPVKLFDVPRLANFRNGIRWTPDGAALTYRDWADGIWKQPLSGEEPQRLPGLPKEKLFTYGWSRDGQHFAFTRGTQSRDVVLLNNFR